jgi:uncharacterized protein YbjT (DUF2867 family)
MITKQTGRLPQEKGNVMDQTILVTGSTGTIGRATVNALHKMGRSARLATRSPSGQHPVATQDDEIVEFDFG